MTISTTGYPPWADWDHVGITQLLHPNEYAVSGKRFRYIQYVNGDEELYDIEKDPHEFVNLAGVVWEVRLEKGGENYGFFMVPDKAHKVLIE